MKQLTSLIFLFSAFSLLVAAEADSYNEALKMAAELNKPILIDFWSDN